MILTKSNYMIGLQCPRYLWIKINHPEKLPETTEAQQKRFDEGHLVGELAQKLFPSGIRLGEDFNENIEKTKELIKQRKTIFEAGIQEGDLYSRADILNPIEDDEWDVLEVKSSSEVKKEHVLDVAFQKFVYLKFGLKIRKCFLVHLNKEYIKKGEINPEELFVKEDITEDVDKIIQDVEPNIKKIFDILKLKEAPDFQLVDIENSFYDNPIIDEFKESLPDGSVFELYNARKKKCIELFGQKICMLVEIPEEYKLTSNQEIQKRCAKTGKPYIDREKIKEFLGELKSPLYYLDFETFLTAIPLYDGTKPYQQIPFQFSLHVVNNGKTEHHSFLWKKKDDSRKSILDELKKVLGTEGSIIVFNKSFEEGRLKELAEIFPEEKEWVQSILDRIVDLIIPFRKFYYYNPKQKGSASIKDVLPAITAKDAYSELEINNGGDATLQFMNATFGEASEEERKKVYDNLEKYCGLDTEGMIWIVDELKEIIK